MSGQGIEPEPDPGAAEPEPAPAAATAAASYTISVDFGSGGGNDTVALDLSSVDDVGGDDVTIYSATGPTPTVRNTGPLHRRVEWAAAPAPLPDDVGGGTWTSGSNYWVELVDDTEQVWYVGSVAASSGSHGVLLRKQPAW